MSRIREFHPAQWNEPILMKTGRSGERGILVPEGEPEISELAVTLPESARRNDTPALPELAQPQVLRHYLRLSQMTMGQALTPDISQGTCTMKYSPLVNERLSALPDMTDIHPLQDPETMQGTLEMLWKLQECICEISGMDAVSLQPSGGSQAIYTNACLIRAYHASRGEEAQRNEIISTAYSHPADCAAPNTAGFRVITLFPDESGYPGVEALRAAVSNRTAGLMITNPEDTGIYNPHIEEFVRIVHEAGGLCAYDQANANGILGVARAREAGFDMCHFNLHKTFSAPHGSNGPGCGAVGVTAALEPFLPKPVICRKGDAYLLDYDRPQSIGKVRSFLGNVQVALRSYAWIMTLGAEGLRRAAELSVLNNNYLTMKLSQIRGIELAYPDAGQRLEQTRFSWEPLFRDTGVTTQDIRRRMVDYGLQSYHESHHPVIIPNPFTFEPTETYSKADMDYYAEVLAEISADAYAQPDKIKNAPERGLTGRIDEGFCSDEETRAMTWRAYVRKHGRTE